MSTPTLIMWAVVAVVGIPSAWRNPTAAALVLAKIAGWIWYRITGDNLPVEFYLFPDIFVISVIMAKTEACNLRPYLNTLHHLKCLILERSVPDRLVMGIFVVEWVLYVAPLHAFYVWWALWGLTIAQFLAAGWESLSPFLWRAFKALSNKPDNTGSLLVAYEGGGNSG